MFFNMCVMPHFMKRYNTIHSIPALGCPEIISQSTTYSITIVKRKRVTTSKVQTTYLWDGYTSRLAAADNHARASWREHVTKTTATHGTPPVQCILHNIRYSGYGPVYLSRRWFRCAHTSWVPFYLSLPLEHKCKCFLICFGTRRCRFATLSASNQINKSTCRLFLLLATNCQLVH
jgi:hypothetical protein